MRVARHQLDGSHGSCCSSGDAVGIAEGVIASRGMVWIIAPLLCGFLMVVQADLNSKAGDLVGNPLFGTLVNMVGAVVGIAAVGAALQICRGDYSIGEVAPETVALLPRDLPVLEPRADGSPAAEGRLLGWGRRGLLLLGTGPLAAVSMSMSLAAIPRTGVLSFNMCSTSGRLAVAGVVDHFGLLGEGLVKPMSSARFLAALLTPAGLLLCYGGGGRSELVAKLAVEAPFLVLSAVSGGIWPIADSFLIRLDAELGPSRKVDLGVLVYAAGVLSVLALMLTSSSLFGFTGGVELLQQLPHVARTLPLYIWVGGLMGTIQFYCSIVIQKKTGAMSWLLGTMAGQLLLSMALDAVGFLGFEERPVTTGKLLGSLLALLSTGLLERVS